MNLEHSHFSLQNDRKSVKEYKIHLTVAIYRNGSLSFKKEIDVPTIYSRRNEARAHILKELKERLRTSNFFRSTRPDYDLVRYTEEATCNTFLRYKIIEL